MALMAQKSPVATITAYLQSLPKEQREVLARIDTLIRAQAPQLKRRLWQQKLWGGTFVQIIGYGEYRTTYTSGREVRWFLIGLTAHKADFSLYVNAVQDGKYLAEAYKDTLGKVRVGKSLIRFKTTDTLNLEALTKLIKQASKNPPSNKRT
jgi:hypothetical protein